MKHVIEFAISFVENKLNEKLAGNRVSYSNFITERYDTLASLIFAKAVQEPMFATEFSGICKILCEKLKMPEVDGKTVSFKALLLKKCQHSFQKGKGELDEAEKKELSSVEKETYEEIMFKKKKEFLGVIIFITELYKQFLVPSKVIVEGCIRELMNRIVNKESSFVEPLHKMLMNIGALLESEFQDEKKARYKEVMENYYNTLRRLKDDAAIGNRERFMIDDILEHREECIREIVRKRMMPNRVPSPVVRTISITPKRTPSPSSSVSKDSVGKLIFSTLDEFMSGFDKKSSYEYFDSEVINTDYGYVLMPQMFRYVVENNLTEEETVKIGSLLCEYSPFVSSEHKDLVQAIDELLNVLGDVEDATDKVISLFSTFMSMVLQRLNFSTTAELVVCLNNLKDFDPFCSSKEKKKFGVPALYFAYTVAAVKKHNPEEATLMMSRAKDYSQLFNNDEQRKELCALCGISDLISS